MHSRTKLLVGVVAALWLVLPGLVHYAPGQQAEGQKKADLPAGHSYHGEVFNEGPRQKAYLMGGTGQVHFAITTKVPLAQQFFDQGVGQLHGFWYFEAERSFRQVAALDPDCAMAYWGMTMANHGNDKRARGFIDKAVALKTKAGRREQLWIDGLAGYVQAAGKDQKDRCRKYIRSLENIIHEFPDDVEAKAFLAVRIWQFNDTLPISSYQAVDALLDQVFAVNPMHPAHHYRIHLWDSEKAERALGSAARCGQSAPGIAHMWHMPGHIYSRLQRYADAVWQQEASSRADHAHMIRDRVLPDQIHNYAHNQEWLIRDLSHIGRARDAVALAKNLVELPRHPRYNTLSQSGKSASYGRTRLFEVLERFELWDDTIALAGTMYLEPTDDAQEQIKRLRLLGLAHAGKGDLPRLKEQIAELEGRLEKAGGTRAPARAGEGKKPDKEVAKEARPPAEKQPEKKPAQPEVMKIPSKEVQGIEKVVNELKAYEALVSGDGKTALELIKKVNGVNNSRLAYFHLGAGDKQKAEELARQAADAAPNQVAPLAHYVEVLHACGKAREAADAFARLRGMSGNIDTLEAPLFKRLEPIARAQGLTGDWRQPAVAAKDVGDRPPLDSIGPFRWHPSPAPDWTLFDATGKSISLGQYRGKPVVVIFYLGHGCLHCVEQLNKFAPKGKEFADAGISLVAISSEGPGEMKKAQEKEPQGSFPFPLVSDEKREVFKAYRSHDDFENQPLHGTFLVDGQGLVRWQDISYEPFTDADFLLNEAQRLLKLPADGPASGTVKAASMR